MVGLIGARFMKGRMVILGYTLWGVLILLFALSNNLGVAIGLAFGQGVANMVFVIPSQTLFQERTPGALMGRVVGFRFALVFGSMTIAMLLGSVLGQIFGPGPVMAVFGLVTVGRGPGGAPRSGRARRLRSTVGFGSVAGFAGGGFPGRGFVGAGDTVSAGLAHRPCRVRVLLPAARSAVQAR